jgi:hypothetical protein
MMMKSFAPLLALLLAGTMPGPASAQRASVDPQNQFHFQPVGPSAALAHRVPGMQAHGLGRLQSRDPKVAASPAKAAPASTRSPRPHTANPPTGKIGFLSAPEIPAGGHVASGALAADFNGDGKLDLITTVVNYDSSNFSAYIYTSSFSVVLGNGDGTFQAPILTNVPLNDPCPEFVVGDLNGDGKPDLLVTHPNCGTNGNFPVGTFDVLLGKGDGTFALITNNTNNTLATNPNVSVGGTLADVNGDGKLDLIAVDQNFYQNTAATVLTLLGNGDGTFQAPTSVALSGPLGGPTTFVDLNGDGLLDIASIGGGTSQVIVYLATSATSYAPAAVYGNSASNYGISSFTVGDLNGDGKPEIVTANYSDSGNDVTVFVNNGDGTFATGVNYDGAMSGSTNSAAADVLTRAVTIADVNGDGKADIVAYNSYSADITVLLGNGDGTVNIPTVGYAFGGNPLCCAGVPLSFPVVADFNGDGLPDVVVADSAFSFVYLKGYGDGTFRSALHHYAPTPSSTTSTSSFTWGIATGDFNGDGQPDFVVGNGCPNCNTGQGITVFLSRPDGSLQPGVNYGSPASLSYVAVADFNGDGKLDIAAIDSSAGVVQVFTGDGSGNFTIGPSFNTDLINTPGPLNLVVGDFNGDGHPDLAIVNVNGDDVAILLNDGTGNFSAPMVTTLSYQVPQGLAAGDVNGDGKLDLVVNSGGSVAVLLGNGDGTFQAERDVTLGGYYSGAVVLADFNGDGKLDIAATAETEQLGQDLIGVALGNGDGTFGTFSMGPSSLQNFYNLGRASSYFMQAADIDGDGKLDLVYTNSEYGTVGILFGEGNGTFYDPVEYAVSDGPWGLAVADVNGDGAPDVVIAGNFPGVTVLLNNNGVATQPNFTITSPQSSATVTPGSTATYNLVITPSNFYHGTISFSCGSLPSETACSFQPATLTPNGNGQWSTQLTVTTTAVSSAALHRAGSPMMLATFSGIGLFGLVFAGRFKKNRLGVVVATLAFVMMTSLLGCGGSNNNNGGGVKSNPGTPAGSYTVVVTAMGTSTGRTVSHTSNLTLSVQ